MYEAKSLLLLLQRTPKTDALGRLLTLLGRSKSTPRAFLADLRGGPRHSKTPPRWLQTVSEASWERLGSILLENLIFDRCMKRNHYFCSSRGLPKPSWAPLGGSLEASWRLAGGFGSVLGRFGSVLEILERSWRSLEASGTVQKRSKSSPGIFRRRSQRLQDACKTAPDGFQGVLGTSWKRLGSILLENLIFDRCMMRNHHFCFSRGLPKPSWRPLGGILEICWRLRS